MKVALVHDFLLEYGGAERVLEVLHELYPKAPVYMAFYDPKSLGKQAERFKGWDIKTSWGTKLPFWRTLISPYRVFSKSFFESFDLSEFDLVISSSNAYMAKAVKVPNGVHICYCHTPPRFLWGYPTALNWQKNLLLKALGTIINHFMRVWDFETAQPPSHSSFVKTLDDKKASEGQGRVNYFIANSKEVQSRIKKFYRRDSTVIYPPVDVDQFALKKETTNHKLSTTNGYFLVVSRLVAAKNVDLAVEICRNLNLNLKVVGTGRELDRLKELVSRHSGERSDSRIGSKDSGQARMTKGQGVIEFLRDVDDQELVGLYQNCRAVIFPASMEDFGLVPVEAMAAGAPVIALAEGGVKETVIDQKTGLLVEDLAPGAFVVALNVFMAKEKKGEWDREYIRKHAEKFSKERFKKEILKFVAEKVK